MVGCASCYIITKNLLGFSEECEIDAAVCSVLDEAGVGGEVVGLAVFEDEESAVGQCARAHDEVGELAELGQGIGGVCKDEGELFGAAGEVFEHVAPDSDGSGIAQGGEHLANEAEMLVVFLDADDAPGSAREELEGDAARAAKEVEGMEAFKVEVGTEDVEEVLLGEVGGGSCLEGGGDGEVASFVFSGYGTHE